MEHPLVSLHCPLALRRLIFVLKTNDNWLSLV